MGRKYTGVLASARDQVSPFGTWRTHQAGSDVNRCNSSPRSRRRCCAGQRYAVASWLALASRPGSRQKRSTTQRRAQATRQYAPRSTVRGQLYGMETGTGEGVSGSKLTAYVVPPHCRARHRQMTPGRRASRPRTLSCSSLSLRLLVSGLVGI